MASSAIRVHGCVLPLVGGRYTYTIEVCIGTYRRFVTPKQGRWPIFGDELAAQRDMALKVRAVLSIVQTHEILGAIEGLRLPKRAAGA